MSRRLREVMGQLERLGTAQNRKVYARHGATEPLFGVSFGNLRKLARSIGPDPALAEALWSTGNTDARILATMVCEPATMSSAQLSRWVKEPRYYVLMDCFVSGVAAKSRFAMKKSELWRRSRSEWIGQAGWQLLAHIALGDTPELELELTDAYFRQRIVEIERTVHGQKNRVKHAMNNALIAIGGRNATLQKRALAAARRIGKVEVDHGLTGCKTPDAADYIRRVAAHRGRKGAGSRTRTRRR